MEINYSSFLPAKGLLLMIISLSNCAKILYLPFPLYSHIQTATWLKDDLQVYGHDIWIAYPDVLANRGVMNDSSLNVIKFNSSRAMDADKNYVQPAVDYYLDPSNFRRTTSGSAWNLVLQQVDLVLQYMDPTMPSVNEFLAVGMLNEAIISDSDLLETIRQHNFDLMLVDGSIGMPLAVIPYKLDIPFCFLGAFFDSWRTGTPTYPSFSPVIGLGTHDSMNFRERIISMIHHSMLMVAHPIFVDSIVAKYAPEKPYISLTQLIGKAQLFLLELDVLLDFPRATMPNTVFVGGLSVRNAKPLRGKFKTFYDRASNGVVVVSFGGSLISLPRYLSEKLRRAFSMTKYSFVWRSNMTSDQGNILVSDWLPQNDLLGHPSTKLFITHCGAYSQFESLYHGVPMIGLPVYAEQHYNSHRMAWKKFGLAMDFHDTAEDLAEAIIKATESPVYRTNIKKASKIFKDRPLTPRQEAAYWLDHVIKYGGSHFRSAGLDLPWYQFLCIDILIVFLVLAIVSIYMWYIVLVCIYKRLFKSKKTKVE